MYFVNFGLNKQFGNRSGAGRVLYPAALEGVWMHDSDSEVDQGEAGQDGRDDVETEELQTLQLQLILVLDNRVSVLLL